MRPDRVLPFLRPGRLVHVREGGTVSVRFMRGVGVDWRLRQAGRAKCCLSQARYMDADLRLSASQLDASTQPPRLTQSTQDWGWGVVISVIRKPPGGKRHAAPTAADGAPDASTLGTAAPDPASYYIVDCLLACAPGSVEANAPRPAAIGGSSNAGGGSSNAGGGSSSADPVVIPVAMPLIQELSTLRVALPGDLRPAEARWAAGWAALVLDGLSDLTLETVFSIQESIKVQRKEARVCGSYVSTAFKTQHPHPIPTHTPHTPITHTRTPGKASWCPCWTSPTASRTDCRCWTPWMTWGSPVTAR